MLKLNTSCDTESIDAVIAAEEDLVSASQECCDAYQALLSAGLDCTEIVDVMRNVEVVRDTVKNHGIRAYYYQFDKTNEFAANFGVTPYMPGTGLGAAAELSTQYVAAAEEGMGVLWTKFIEALKTMWARFSTWLQTTLTFRSRYTKKVSELMTTFNELDVTKTADILPAKTALMMSDAIYVIHDLIKAGANIQGLSNKLESLARIFNALDAAFLTPSNIKTLHDVGYDIVGVDPTASSAAWTPATITSAQSGFNTQCATSKKTLTEHGWSTATVRTFVSELVKLETRAEFKQNATKWQESAKSLINNVDRAMTTKKESDDKAKDKDATPATTSGGDNPFDVSETTMITYINGNIRTIYKLQVVENQLVIRALKTAIKLLECNTPKA